MLQHISIANKFCSFDLSVQLKNHEKLYDGFHKNVCSRPTKKLFHQHIKQFLFKDHMTLNTGVMTAENSALLWQKSTHLIYIKI